MDCGRNGKVPHFFSHPKRQRNNRIQVGESDVGYSNQLFIVGLERKNDVLFYHYRLKMIDGLLYRNSFHDKSSFFRFFFLGIRFMTFFT